MISKTRGIVFKTIKYSDNSLIVKVYTETLGLRTYMIRGLNSKKSSVKKGAFQPLSMLDLLVYEKEKGGIQSIRELEIVYPYHSIPFNIQKGCIALFINEVMYSAISSEMADPALFNFLQQTLIGLDETKDHFENLHLLFLTGLTNYLGISPRNNYSPANQFFDLQEGIFVNQPPLHVNWLDETLSLKLFQMMTHPENAGSLFVNSAARNEFMSRMIEYYRLHIPGFGEMKSPAVLREVLI